MKRTIYAALLRNLLPVAAAGTAARGDDVACTNLHNSTRGPPATGRRDTRRWLGRGSIPPRDPRLGGVRACMASS
jgi:hypothetical protein